MQPRKFEAKNSTGRNSAQSGQPTAHCLHLAHASRAADPGDDGQSLYIAGVDFGPGKAPLIWLRPGLMMAQHHKALFQGPAAVFTPPDAAREAKTEECKMGLEFGPRTLGQGCELEFDAPPQLRMSLQSPQPGIGGGQLLQPCEV